MVVVLDGTEGYGSSFLEEAFGGLVRMGYSVERLTATLKPTAISPDFETYVEEIWDYIREESEHRQPSQPA